MRKILIIVTNHSTIGNTNIKNGTFVKEVTHFLKPIVSNSFLFEIGSIKGGMAPIYGEDMEGDKIHDEIFNLEDFQQKIKNTKPLSSLNPLDYSAVFYPGGLGLLSDLANDEYAANFASKLYENGGVLSAVCHGSACLLPIFLKNGKRLLKQKSVTGFSLEEEELAKSIDHIPIILEKELIQHAKEYTKGEPLKEYIVQDGRVITGQNPTSAYAVGKLLVSVLLT